MNTKQYVAHFGLDKENQEFNRDEFLRVFGNEFLERLKITQAACQKMDTQFTWHKFQILIKEQQKKFESISNKKIGEPFTDNLWKAFFAIIVVPIRQEYFPKEHEELTKEWRRRNGQERVDTMQLDIDEI